MPELGKLVVAFTNVNLGGEMPSQNGWQKNLPDFVTGLLLNIPRMLQNPG
jgi:hypothetical protein